jgi:hypothetical protein
MSLYDELTTGPLAAEIAPFLAARNGGAIATVMTRKDIAAKGALSSHDIKQYLSLIGLRIPIMDSAAPACREASQALADFESFELSNSMILAKFTAILDGLVIETLIPDFTETHKLTILAMADKLISRAEQLGISVSEYSIMSDIDWSTL